MCYVIGMDTVTPIPTGANLETVIDRLTRAANFASNGAFFAAESDDPIATLDTYINAAQSMIDDARTTLKNLKE